MLECLVGKLVHTLGVLRGNVDLKFLHHLHSPGVQPDGIRPGARDFISVSSQMAQQPLRHLAAG